MRVISGDWFTQDDRAVGRRAGGGMGPAIVGTLVITARGRADGRARSACSAAIYLHEYGGRGRLARLIRFMADVMTGVPSIIMGLFIYTIWTLRFGLSGFGGALALACLMLPIVIRSTEEMLRLVPDELRHGSYALGNRKWRTILTVVLPAALGGIISGVMLAVARAAGETAPLLFTVGAARAINANIFDGREHRPVAADLHQRPAALRAGPGPGLGRGPHPGGHRVHLHRARPDRRRPLLPQATDEPAQPNERPDAPATVRTAEHPPDDPPPEALPEEPCHERRADRRSRPSPTTEPPTVEP